MVYVDLEQWVAVMFLQSQTDLVGSPPLRGPVFERTQASPQHGPPQGGRPYERTQASPQHGPPQGGRPYEAREARKNLTPTLWEDNGRK